MVSATAAPVAGKSAARSRQRLASRRTREERDKLVEANLPLANWAVKRHARLARGDDFDDLLQAALVGLLRAAEVWNPERGAFSTCASWWMFQAVGREQRRLDLVRIPDHVAGDVRARLRQKLRPRRLPRTSAEAELPLADPGAVDPAEAAVTAETARLAMRYMYLARRRERQALRMRYLWDMPVKKIARRLGVSTRRVWQLLASGLARARARLAEE